jgi:beta-mannosidase
MESWASMATMTLPADLTADGNSSMMFFRMRQDWPNGQEVLLGQLGVHYDMPTSKNQTEAYKQLTYLSQVVHAHCVTLSSSHFRLMRGSAAGTMGLMFWSLNNQWQGQSDAAIDYTGRWKLLQHATSRFYSPMLLHIHAGWDTQINTGWNETNITTGIINDTPHEGKGVAAVVLRSWATGAALRTWNTTGPVPAYSSFNFSKVSRATYLDGHAAETVFLTATVSLERGDADVTRAHHYFTKMKAAAMKDPEIKLT